MLYNNIIKKIKEVIVNINKDIDTTHIGVPVNAHRYLPSRAQQANADLVFLFLILCASSRSRNTLKTSNIDCLNIIN